MNNVLNQFFIALLLIATTLPTFAQSSGPVQINVNENQVYAEIELPGDITADITITFENAVGLTKESIGLTAELIDVTSPSFLDRLPNNLLVTPSAAFPMMITIEPLASSGFSFSGLTVVDLHTHNLEYTANTPLRLYKAPLNGEFKDITMTLGAGSIRARGSTGKFSQFIIAADVRAPQTVITEKFADLNNALTSFSSQIESNTYIELANQAALIQQLINNAEYYQAAKAVTAFNQLVDANEGLNVPNVWRSSRDISNVAGELMAYANTLRFSLRLIK